MLTNSTNECPALVDHSPRPDCVIATTSTVYYTTPSSLVAIRPDGRHSYPAYKPAGSLAQPEGDFADSDSILAAWKGDGLHRGWDGYTRALVRGWMVADAERAVASDMPLEPAQYQVSPDANLARKDTTSQSLAKDKFGINLGLLVYGMQSKRALRAIRDQQPDLSVVEALTLAKQVAIATQPSLFETMFTTEPDIESKPKGPIKPKGPLGRWVQPFSTKSFAN